MVSRGPVTAAFRRRHRRNLRVLAYHGVEDPNRFDAQLRVLCAEFRPVDLATVEDALEGLRELPEHAVLVTFDDGEPSLVHNGLPALVRHRVPAVAFVVAGLVGTDDPYWWDEVLQHAGPDGARLVAQLKQIPDALRRSEIAAMREGGGLRLLRTAQLDVAQLHELERGGVRVENHSLTHPCLNRCDDGVVTHEIRRSHELLQGWLGRPPRAFAYPNGNLDGRARDELERSGYGLAFGFDHQLAVLPVDDRLAVSRIRVSSTTPLSRFRLLVSGVHPWLHRRLGRS